MDPWDPPKPSRTRRPDHHHPSFSSSLLDQIYRSFDDSSSSSSSVAVSMSHPKHHRRSDLDLHRHSLASDFDRSAPPRSADSFLFKHSASSSASSSDSSGFSSSESDSFYARSASSRSPPVRRGRDLAADLQNPKPIRTSVAEIREIHRSSVQKPNGSKQELGSFLRTKSRALKMYSDLKKVKQPISPGGRLASFLNSIFTAGNTKKPKKSTAASANAGGTTSTATATVTAEQPLSSACSSASSFSRSCLSKTPSSSGKSKRSVRFCPVSVILDEESRPCGHKKLYESDPIRNGLDALEIHVMEENRRVIEAAKDLLRSYQKNKDLSSPSATTTACDVIDLDEDDDAASYASSDLFELDNLSAIGIERYREELPVYETTHLTTNRAIASGLI